MRSLLLSVLLCTPATVFADVEIHFNDGSTGLVSDGRVLFGDEESSVLFEEGQEYFIVIEWKKRTYMRLTPGFAAAALRSVGFGLAYAFISYRLWVLPSLSLSFVSNRGR